MPKPKLHLSIKLNLLKPQSNPEKLPLKLFRWLLASGRYIFVFVEALVLVAFISRFKLDADLQSKKEAIEEQIPYIESLKTYEVLIKQTQLKLSTIATIKKNSPDWSLVLEKIADQMPSSMKLISINITKNASNSTAHISGQTQINSDLTSFITNLKDDSSFSNVNIASVGLEQGVIKFTIDASVKSLAGEKSL